jgi:hypothetical protein
VKALLVKWVVPYVAAIAVVVGMVNFGWVFLESLAGSAQSGRVTDGHYFLYSRWTGRTTEVSREEWQWREFHESTLIITHVLAMVAAG